MRNRIASTLILGLIVFGAAASAGQAMVYHVEIVDLDPGQPLTPPVAVVHGSGYALFETGMAATPGLEMLAEDGLTDALIEEAQASAGVRQALVGGGGPTFASFKFLIEGEPGDLFSYASMFARTNDVFTGLSGVALPPAGMPLTLDAMAYDAGTEVNTGLAAHIPAYGNVDAGETENGTVQPIEMFSIMDDPDAGMIDFAWPPAAQVIITPMPNAIEYELTLEGLSEGQPLTPPLLITHSADAMPFELGAMASPGLELLAEEGASGDWANELRPLDGVWTVMPFGDGPGFGHSTTFTAEPGMLLSLASMFARTNDVVTGVMGYTLPEGGVMEVIETMAYDAGTEMNTGLVEHIPFYGNAGGPDEDGVIAVINEYSVLDDPDGPLDFTWPPAARITIEAMGPASNVTGWDLYE